MKLDKFTEKAQEALQEAAELASGLGQQAVEPEHLMLALIRQPGGRAHVARARPLKRAIQRLVQDPLAMMLLEGRLSEGDTVEVDVAGGELTFGKATPAVPPA